MTRNISSLELPISLQANLKNNYSKYWISDLFEVSNQEGTSYYITMENADSKIVLKSSGNGRWNTYKKMAKISARLNGRAVSQFWCVVKRAPSFPQKAGFSN